MCPDPQAPIPADGPGHPTDARGPHRWTPDSIVVSCEHAGNDVPPEFAALFVHTGARTPTLDTHRGIDIGALGVADRLASRLGPRLASPLLATTVTRLLVDCNRSPDAPGVFSEFTRDLPAAARADLLSRYHAPQREAVRRAVVAEIERGRRVLHIGVHSFTDVLDGDVRDVDLALLFDPASPSEAAVCDAWMHALRGFAPRGTRLAFNKPYLGTDDGLTTTLRAELGPTHYAGVEIEARQGTLASPATQHATADLLAESLLTACFAG